jgi:hypothetical protein
VEYRKAYRAKNAEKLKAVDARNYTKNKERVQATVAAYRASNKDRLSATVAAYYEVHKSEISEYQRSYRLAYKNENPEKYTKSKNAWQLANVKIRLIHKHNRRAKLRDAGKLSVDLANRLYEAQKGQCACCGADISTGYHIDHIMPVALGGSNTDENIQLLAPICNLRKGAKHPDDYRRYLKSLI